MKRRKAIRVDTFPFLAVLLCAMGSLILLLLVIDRRAKMAARARTQNEAREAFLLKIKREAVDQDVWEKKCRELHDALVQQDQELKEQLHKILGQKSQTSRKLALEQADVRSLEEAISRQRADLAQQRYYISQRRGTLARAGEKEKASQQELARLARELDQLESTLRDLLALRRREQQAYSLVPYRGKRGDNRKPVYVECTSQGLTFHPGDRNLDLPVLSSSSMLAEVERALGTAAATPNEIASRIYVLFLVRPDGIAGYYAAQEALKGSPVDFGYEFVDADMVFDFAGGQNVDRPRVATASNEPYAAPFLVNRPPEPPPGFSPGPGGSGLTGGPSIAGISTGPVNQSGTGFLGPPMAGGAGGLFGGSGTLPLPTPAPGLNDGKTPPSASPAGTLLWSATGAPGEPRTVPGEPARPDATRGLGPPPGTVSGQGVPAGAQATEGARSDSLPMASTSSSTSGVSITAARPGPTAPAGNNNGAWSPGGASSVAFGQATTPRPVGTSAPAQALEIGTAPPQAGNVGRPPTPAESEGQTKSSRTSIPPDGGESGAGGSDGSPIPTLATPLTAMRPATQARSGPRIPPQAAPRRFANRDFVLVLECTRDAVVLQPWGTRFPLISLAGTTGKDTALVRGVQQRISQRQASVRPDEPPYRPIIRFRVQPDGLRAYYEAYPLLAPLGLPMLREDLDNSRR